MLLVVVAPGRSRLGGSCRPGVRLGLLFVFGTLRGSVVLDRASALNIVPAGLSARTPRDGDDVLERGRPSAPTILPAQVSERILSSLAKHQLSLVFGVAGPSGRRPGGGGGGLASSRRDDLRFRYKRDSAGEPLDH